MISTPRVIELLETKAIEADQAGDVEFTSELLEAARYLSGYAYLEAIRTEVGYVMENLQEISEIADGYDEYKIYGQVNLTADDIDMIADSVWNNEWLNEQLNETIKEAIDEHIDTMTEELGDNFNE